MRTLMSGISYSGAFEIFTNPGDLEISVSESHGEHGFTIARGRGHDFEILFTKEPFTGELEVAVRRVEQVLEDIRLTIDGDLLDPASKARQTLKSNNLTLDPTTVLNAGLIAGIVTELREQRFVNTHGIASRAA